jgi:hypothetical protein
VLDVLRVAAGEGRLTPDELDERVTATLTSRTLGELAVLTADLVAGLAGDGTGTGTGTGRGRGPDRPARRFGPAGRPVGRAATDGAAVVLVRRDARFRRSGDYA